MRDTSAANNDKSTRSILYPFANISHLAKNPPLVIEGGDGVYVTDASGRRYIDGQAGLWNVNVGHGREEIKEAIRTQLDKLSYYSLFGGTTVSPAIELGEVLTRMTVPEGMTRAFFSSGGSEANEAAFKLVRQYWRQRGEPTRIKIISLKRAYHGVTLGALSANGANAYREAYEPLIPGFFQVETPHAYRNPFTSDHDALGTLCAELLEREILYHGPQTIGAFVAEPVQGAGGVIVPPTNFWPKVREICDRYDILMISDEVVTGFGRVGNMMGCRHWGVQPDIMNFAKGINSGYVPLGATMMNSKVADAFTTDDDTSFSPAAFFHGNTYAGHPLACAAAIANLKIIEEEDLPANAGTVGAYFIERLKEVQTRHHNIGDVRGLGLMIGVELVKDPETKTPFELSENFGARIADHCREKGVLIRNLADTFIISPPLILTKAHVDEMVDVFEDALKAVE
ncbi:aminotransferase class III-fold pyridoxal phosphate-dependent enzyme [Halotalea alkalilenta]|uniref:aminotransferase class III-fold pyridoxal phosphate-dependent enzyme n=1 Tax=Halotalea alkalilenta TaxID=376489 RepID=UPI000693EB3A|nr:aminotransferase class III-fold pyridoxal phosphate-dependent enzyme [Halotalea alkalilenta]